MRNTLLETRRKLEKR